MKKLINKSENVLEDVLYGLEAAYPEYLRKLEKFNITIIRKQSIGKFTILNTKSG